MLQLTDGGDPPALPASDISDAMSLMERHDPEVKTGLREQAMAAARAQTMVMVRDDSHH